MRRVLEKTKKGSKMKEQEKEQLQIEYRNSDLNDPKYIDETEEVELHPEADYWDTTPPPDGKYRVKLVPAKTFIEERKTNDGRVFYRANIECRIVDDEKWSNSIIWTNVSTYRKFGQQTSTL